MWLFLFHIVGRTVDSGVNKQNFLTILLRRNRIVIAQGKPAFVTGVALGEMSHHPAFFVWIFDHYRRLETLFYCHLDMTWYYWDK